MSFWTKMFKGKKDKGMGQGPGRQPGGMAQGPGGSCVCPNCGTKVPHKTGIPCYELKCPNCGQAMRRPEL